MTHFRWPRYDSVIFSCCIFVKNISLQFVKYYQGYSYLTKMSFVETILLLLSAACVQRIVPVVVGSVGSTVMLVMLLDIKILLIPKNSQGGHPQVLILPANTTVSGETFPSKCNITFKSSISYTSKNSMWVKPKEESSSRFEGHFL